MSTEAICDKLSSGTDLDDQDDERQPLEIVVPELRQEALEWVLFDPRYRVRRRDEQPFVVQV